MSNLEENTEYNRRQQANAQEARKMEINKALAKWRADTLELGTNISPIAAMDVLEGLLRAAGGEKKGTFLEVNGSMVKMVTRVPITANLFPFLPESEDNPRFHTIIAKHLLLMGFVDGVRSVQLGDVSAGTVVIMSYASI